MESIEKGHLLPLVESVTLSVHLEASEGLRREARRRNLKKNKKKESEKDVSLWSKPLKTYPL